MKNKLTRLFIATAAITLAVGCKGKNSVANDPKIVLTTFFEKLSKKDIEGAAKLATKESKGTLELMKKAMDVGENLGNMSEAKKEKDPAEEFKKMQIGEAKIDGDNATVSVSNPSKDDKVVDFPLKKEDGSWKVDFSMGTLMKMGMNQTGKNSNPFNEDNSGLDSAGLSDKMNNFMNGDSLKKGLEQLDSALKNLDPEKMKKMKDALKSLEKVKDQ